MSDSPKWTSVRISPVVRRQLREERRRRREQERARRAANRERRRKERFSSAQIELCRFLGEIEQELQEFLSTRNGRFISSEGLAEHQAALVRCHSKAEKATDEKRLKPVQRELRRLRKQMSQLIFDAESQKFSAELQQEEAVLRRLKQRLQSAGSANSTKFDPDGLLELDGLFGRIRQRIQRRSLEEARELLQQTLERVAEHEALVEKRATRFEERKRKAERTVSDIEDVIGGIATDEAVMRWRSADISRLDEQLTDIGAELNRGRFAAVEQRCQELRQELKQLEQQAQQEQAKEDQRQYVVESMCSAMRKFGFSIENVQSVEEADPRSDTVIYARRPSGGEIGVSVPQEGDVWYQLAGYPMRADAGSAAGQITRSCDEAEQEIEALHDLLRESFGIETGELNWRDKDPNRVGKHQARLPHSTRRETDQARRQ